MNTKTESNLDKILWDAIKNNKSNLKFLEENYWTFKGKSEFDKWLDRVCSAAIEATTIAHNNRYPVFWRTPCNCPSPSTCGRCNNGMRISKINFALETSAYNLWKTWLQQRKRTQKPIHPCTE